MNNNQTRTIATIVFVLSVLLSACGGLASEVPTGTPQPTATKTLVPTATSTPTRTPRPTRTPNLTATERVEQRTAKVQKYFELGYLPSTEGRFEQFGDFNQAWAQLEWYQSWSLSSTKEENFLLSAHVKWSSAYRNADVSGCGFYFAYREGSDFHYAVFLDRSKVFFVTTDYYYEPVRPTLGTGLVDFPNPADSPVEADLTLIVNDTTAYVLVDGELVGGYTLSLSKILRGYFGISLLSGTNKDYGTRCEMTDIHAFILND